MTAVAHSIIGGRAGRRRFVWTDEKDAVLRKMIAEGRSFSFIADELKCGYANVLRRRAELSIPIPTVDRSGRRVSRRPLCPPGITAEPHTDLWFKQNAEHADRVMRLVIQGGSW